MSQPRSLRMKGTPKGPYGPNNPPPPPPGSPPRRREREEGLATIQDTTGYYKHYGRSRSRSPARDEDRDGDTRYRERFKLRQDGGQQAQASAPPRNDDRQAPYEARSNWGASRREGQRMPSQHLSIRSRDEAGHAQSRHDQAPARGSDWEVDQTRDGGSAPARAVYNHSYHNRYDIDRDVPGQRRDDWQRVPDPHEDDYPQRSPVVEKNGSNTYDRARNEAAPSIARMDRDLEMEDEVDWDDEAIAVADAVPVLLGTTKKLASVQPPRKARRNPQGKQRGARLTKAPSRNFDRMRSSSGFESQKDSRNSAQSRDPGRVASPDRGRENYSPAQVRAKVQPQQVVQAPPTAYDLRPYDNHITTTYSKLPRQERFLNGTNGKVAPSIYGSEQLHDLGLCFTTFCTRFRCEMGVKCPWRHHPLTKAEVAWILAIGRGRGEQFVEGVEKWWQSPEVPVPGASMAGKGE